MPGGSRKTHSKSRNGCGQCKARRKKCDQKPPVCSNCQRWGIVCDYAALSAAVERITSRVFIPPTYANARFSNVAPAPLLDDRSFELLHHYSNWASLSLSTKSTLSIWKDAVPEEAKTHLFLMHSVLALSALHLSYVRIERRDEYISVANQQHEKALATFRSSVGAISCTNGNAVTAFSFLTVVFSAGVPLVFGFARTPDPTSAFIDILLVLRRAYSAVGPVLPGVAKGVLGALIHCPPSNVKACPMHMKGREVLDRLEELNEASNESEEHKSIYREALAGLNKLLEEIQDAPPLWVVTLQWATSTSTEFFDLLQSKQPFALVLLAHWCVPLYRSPSLWFNAWAKNIVGDIWNTLEGESKNTVTWPAEQVGIIPREFHEPRCLCLQCCICPECNQELYAHKSHQSSKENLVLRACQSMVLSTPRLPSNDWHQLQAPTAPTQRST